MSLRDSLKRLRQAIKLYFVEPDEAFNWQNIKKNWRR